MPLSAQDHPRSHPFRRPYAPSSPPEEMKDYPSWLPWRRTCQDGEYWLTPCDYYSGKPLSAFSLRDPDRSMPQRYSRHRSKFSEEYALRYGWEGAGFLLTESDPFVAIRVHDYHPEGSRTIYRWAREIVTRLGGYTEEVLTRCDVRNYLLIIVRCYTSAHGWYGGDFGGRIKIDSSELYIPFVSLWLILHQRFSPKVHQEFAAKVHHGFTAKVHQGRA